MKDEENGLQKNSMSYCDIGKLFIINPLFNSSGQKRNLYLTRYLISLPSSVTRILPSNCVSPRC
jgi:hypothetical protein